MEVPPAAGVTETGPGAALNATVTPAQFEEASSVQSVEYVPVADTDRYAARWTVALDPAEAALPVRAVKLLLGLPAAAVPRYPPAAMTTPPAAETETEPGDI